MMPHGVRRDITDAKLSLEWRTLRVDICPSVMADRRPNTIMPRWLRRAYPLLTRLVLGWILVASLVQAAQACVMSQSSLAVAFSAEEMPAGCEQQGAAGRNVCLADCLQAAQVLDSSHQPGLVASSAVSVVFHPLQNVAPSGASSFLASALLPALPLFLRFQRLLN
jgi:hypothetical protein